MVTEAVNIWPKIRGHILTGNAGWDESCNNLFCSMASSVQHLTMCTSTCKEKRDLLMETAGSVVSHSQRSKRDLTILMAMANCDGLCGIGRPRRGEAGGPKCLHVGARLPGEKGRRFQGWLIGADDPKSRSRSCNKVLITAGFVLHYIISILMENAENGWSSQNSINVSRCVHSKGHIMGA